MTDAEARFWSKVRSRQLGGAKFRRQFPIGTFIADFVCLEAGLIVEIDGGQHADNVKDTARTATLIAEGYRVIRFWNNDVLNNLDGVLEKVAGALAEG